MPFPLVALAAGWLAKIGIWDIAKYLAMKAFVVALCVTMLPLSIFYGFGYIMEFLFGMINSTLQGSGIEPVVVQVTGVGAYLVTACRIPEAFSVYFSLIGMSFMLKLVRLK